MWHGLMVVDAGLTGVMIMMRNLAELAEVSGRVAETFRQVTEAIEMMILLIIIKITIIILVSGKMKV